jgi:hypothetical protein
VALHVHTRGQGKEPKSGSILRKMSACEQKALLPTGLSRRLSNAALGSKQSLGVLEREGGHSKILAPWDPVNCDGPNRWNVLECRATAPQTVPHIRAGGCTLANGR